MLSAKNLCYTEQLLAESVKEEREFQTAAEPFPAELANTALYSDYRPRSFCFTGGKGGVGKTTLLLLTANYLARQNYPVRIIDCDPLPKAYRQATNKLSRTNERNKLPSGAVVYTLLSSNAEYERSTYDLQAKPFAESLYTYGELNALTKQALSGIKEAPLKLLVNLGLLAQKELTPDSIILYDCAAGLEFTSTLPYFLTTYFFVVTNPELPALQDAAGVVKTIAQNEHLAKNIYPVVNRIPVWNKKILLTSREVTAQMLSNMWTLFDKWAVTSGAANFTDDTIYIADGKNIADIRVERLGQKILELLKPAEGL
jgi:MinD-like ATPase involved in chromosome partitioning or flagellar assembly